MIELLERSEIAIAGSRAVVIGRSDIVGKPMALLLLHRHATVTICHSRTPKLAAVAAEADILVSAIGRPAFVTPEFVKPGATVIDVGITSLTDRATVERLFAAGSKRREDVRAPRLDHHRRRAPVGGAGGRRPQPGPRRGRTVDDRDAAEEHGHRCDRQGEEAGSATEARKAAGGAGVSAAAMRGHPARIGVVAAGVGLRIRMRC